MSDENIRLDFHQQLGLPRNAQGAILEFLYHGQIILLRAVSDSVLKQERSYQLVLRVKVLGPINKYDSGEVELRFLSEHCVWNLGIRPLGHSGSILLTGGAIRAPLLTTPDAT
jgi:hypothetical protein